MFDVVAETAGDDGAIFAFGRHLAEPGWTVAVWAMAALVATAAFGLTFALASASVRFRERRTAAELDARFERLAAEGAALMVRRAQTERTLETLRRRIEALARERQAIIEGPQSRSTARARAACARDPHGRGARRDAP